MRIFIDSGHFDNDPGAVVGEHLERDINKDIRDHLKDIMPYALFVPDDLNLKDTIKWINGQADVKDIAVAIHLNANNDKTIRGTECYYYLSKELAKTLSFSVSQRLGIPNRGAKPDTQSFVGSLGFCRDIKCSSVVLEVGYMTNVLDLDKILKDKERIAEGIYTALALPAESVLEKKISEMQRVIDVLIAFITNKLSH